MQKSPSIKRKLSASAVGSSKEKEGKTSPSFSRAATSEPTIAAKDEPTPMMLDPEIFDCPLCQSILYDPVTTSCGHSFCKDCILRAMDHDHKCPLCRTVIYITAEHGINILLQTIIKTHFKNAYLERSAEIKADKKAQSMVLPLFLLGESSLFPQMALPLHIFEPRYRLMMRRCINGDKRFGVVPRINGRLADVGCIALIENHYQLPDGRSLVATQGEKRFKLLSASQQDGYMVAKVSILDDEPEDKEVAKNLMDYTTKAVKQKFGSVLKQIEDKYGAMPTDPASLSWWLAAIMPLSPADKVALNNTCTAAGRLERIIKLLTAMKPRRPTSSTPTPTPTPTLDMPSTATSLTTPSPLTAMPDDVFSSEDPLNPRAQPQT